MEYISTEQAAKKWGISQRRVVRLSGDNRIQGAKLFGGIWMIPEDAEKPADLRTKKKLPSIKPVTDFRFPLLINHDESDYQPPLSEEERQLRQGQVDFYACRVPESKRVIFPLSENATNRYVRISALFHRCYISEYENNIRDYNRTLYEFNRLLAEDFPYKKEMLLFRYMLDQSNGRYASLLEGLNTEPGDEYHPSAYYMATQLSLCTLADNDFTLFSRLRYETYELLCTQMERDGYYLEAQLLHCLLIEIYRMQTNNEKMISHMRRALKIGLEHELYFYPAIHFFYYPDITKKVFKEFPKDFAEKISSLSDDVRKKYSNFADTRNELSYWNLLSKNEFVYISLAFQGYSNKQVASTLNRSDKYVSRMYSQIYDKLNVKNKNELIDLINAVQIGDLSEPSQN